ncbi:MAG: hypothetical protein WDZ31_06265 [Phycisphaeraceae bacterium]
MSGAEEQSNTPGSGRRMFDAEPAPSHARDLVLVKKNQRFVFRCEAGQEASLLARLRDLVDDPDVNLNWFDAAVLSHQVGEQMAKRLKRMPPGDSDA